MIILEEKLKKQDVRAYVFYCGECNVEVAIPEYSSVLRNLICNCGKEMEVAGEVIITKYE